MIQPQEIKDALIKELGFSSLSDENKDLLLSKFGESLLKRVMAVTLDNLSEDSRIEFETLSKEGDNDKLRDFLKVKIPNIEELTQREIKEGVEEFKNIVSELK